MDGQPTSPAERGYNDAGTKHNDCKPRGAEETVPVEPFGCGGGTAAVGDKYAGAADPVQGVSLQRGERLHDVLRGGLFERGGRGWAVWALVG